MISRWLRVLIAALLLLAFAGACGDDDDDAGGGDTDGEGAEASEVTLKTNEYGYPDLPASFAGGLVEITLDNSAGNEAHEADLTLLTEGKTFEDYQASWASLPALLSRVISTSPPAKLAGRSG
jgi:hypothetical protein